MEDQYSTELEKLHRCFPALMGLPDVLASVDGTLAADPRQPGLRWQLLLQVLAHAVLAADRTLICLGVSVPALRRAGDLDIAVPSAGRSTPLVWDIPAINRLRAKNCHRWVDLAQLTPRDLAEMPYAGHKAVPGIVAQVLTFGWDSDGFTSAGGEGESRAKVDEEVLKPSSHKHMASGVAEWAEPEHKALQILWRWASTERQARSLGDLVRLISDAKDVWPDEVRTAIEHLREVPLKQPGPDSEPMVLIHNWYNAQDERVRDLFTRRVFRTDKQATLDELAKGHGVTRERMRQIARKVVPQLQEWMLSAEAESVRWRVASIRDHVGPWCITDKRLAAVVGYDDHADDCLGSPEAALLLGLAGPYRRDGQYLTRDGFTLPPIEAAASETGLVDLDVYRNLLTEVGVLPVYHEAAIEVHAEAVREFNGAVCLWNGGVASKAVAALAALGRPTSADEIASLFGSGMAASRIRGAFSTDSRVMRSGKTVWALVEWGFEEYSGIAEEIRERLEAAGGGPLRLRSLIDELVDRFGVSDNSVRTYSDAPAFVVADGGIRLRTSNDPYPVFTNLSRVRGIYVDGRAVIAHLALDAGIVRNGSCYVHRIVAGRLGVAPGERAIYRWGGDTVQLHWPLTSPTGPLLTGLRPVFDEHTAKPGDVLRLRFDPVGGQVTSEQVDEDAARIIDQVARLRVLTGLQLLEAHDIEEQVAAAIEVQTSRVRDALRDRGDEAVAASIPFRVVTDAPNDELAAIFDELDRDLGFG